jgi:hypothetical protein
LNSDTGTVKEIKLFQNFMCPERKSAYNPKAIEQKIIKQLERSHDLLIDKEKNAL